MSIFCSIYPRTRDAITAHDKRKRDVANRD
jgi:hypothetical protein